MYINCPEVTSTTRVSLSQNLTIPVAICDSAPVASSIYFCQTSSPTTKGPIAVWMFQYICPNNCDGSLSFNVKPVTLGFSFILKT